MKRGGSSTVEQRLRKPKVGDSTSPRRAKPIPAKALPKVEAADAITAACFGSLRLFVEEAWPIVVPSEPFQGNWHIDAICDHLEALFFLSIRNLLISVPPRFGKSTVVSVMFPAWAWARDPMIRMLYSSYAQTLSTRDSVATRRLIESPWYQERWGHAFKITTDQNEKMRFENDKRGYRLATSVGGANTGEGGDLIAADDPHNVKEVESEVMRRAAVQWWNEVMSTRGNNPATARRLVIGQRTHEEDLSGDIMEKGDYTHLNLPMEFEKAYSIPTLLGTSIDPRVEDADLLWPARYDRAWVEAQKRAMGSYAYAAQFQQRPAPLEGGMFRRADWRYFKESPESILEKSHDRCWSWDMAFKDKESSDFVAGLPLARVGANIYVLASIHDRMSFSATKQAVKNGRAKFPRITAILVEDKANGTAVVDDLHSTVPGMIAVEPEGGKESRAWVMQPVQEAGNIWLPEGAQWCEDFVQELGTFPNGKNDDWVDALSQGVNWLLKRYNVPSGGYVTSVTRSTHQADQEQPTFRDPRYA